MSLLFRRVLLFLYFCRRFSPYMARLKQTCRKANNRVSRENVVHDISKTFKALHKLQLQSKLTGGIKEPSHWRPSSGTLLEIRRYQRTTNLLIPKLCFQRVVKSITEELFHGIRFQTQALHALQVLRTGRTVFALICESVYN